MKYKNNKFENKPKINLQRAKGRGGGRGEERKKMETRARKHVRPKTEVCKQLMFASKTDKNVQ